MRTPQHVHHHGRSRAITGDHGQSRAINGHHLGELFVTHLGEHRAGRHVHLALAQHAPRTDRGGKGAHQARILALGIPRDHILLDLAVRDPVDGVSRLARGFGGGFLGHPLT